MTTVAWTGALFGRTLSVPHHLPSLGRLPPAGGQVARRLPGRHSSVAASRCAASLGLLWGAEAREDRHLGAVMVVFCQQAHAGHFGRLVGTATPLRGHWRPRSVRASALLSRVLVGAGVTPAVHSFGPAPLAPVVSALIVRVRTVGYTPTARQTTHAARLIRPQGSLPRVAAWRACLPRSAPWVLLVFRHAVDSKQHGRSVPPP